MLGLLALCRTWLKVLPHLPRPVLSVHVVSLYDEAPFRPELARRDARMLQGYATASQRVVLPRPYSEPSVCVQFVSVLSPARLSRDEHVESVYYHTGGLRWARPLAMRCSVRERLVVAKE